MAKHGEVSIDNTVVEYIVFGKGEMKLVIIPGLSDSMTSVKGKRWLLSNYYKDFAKDFCVYVISRKNEIVKGYTTREMAKDYTRVMDVLGIQSAHIFGISQGGMIAQWLAIDYPSYVQKLILGVTISRPNETIIDVGNRWILLIKKDRYGDYMVDAVEKMYSEKKLKQYRKVYFIIKRIGKPKSYQSFFVQAEACIKHNAYDRLKDIDCQTLVIGGDDDKVVGLGASQEIASQINDAKLIVYKGLGHGAYDENKAFSREVVDFLLME